MNISQIDGYKMRGNKYRGSLACMELRWIVQMLRIPIDRILIRYTKAEY